MLAVPTDSSYALVCHLTTSPRSSGWCRIRGVDDAPPDAAVPRPQRTGQLRTRRQPAVPPCSAPPAPKPSPKSVTFSPVSPRRARPSACACLSTTRCSELARTVMAQRRRDHADPPDEAGPAQRPHGSRPLRAQAGSRHRRRRLLAGPTTVIDLARWDRATSQKVIAQRTRSPRSVSDPDCDNPPPWTSPKSSRPSPSRAAGAVRHHRCTRPRTWLRGAPFRRRHGLVAGAASRSIPRHIDPGRHHRDAAGRYLQPAALPVHTPSWCRSTSAGCATQARHDLVALAGPGFELRAGAGCGRAAICCVPSASPSRFHRHVHGGPGQRGDAGVSTCSRCHRSTAAHPVGCCPGSRQSPVAHRALGLFIVMALVVSGIIGNPVAAPLMARWAPA